MLPPTSGARTVLPNPNAAIHCKPSDHTASPSAYTRTGLSPQSLGPGCSSACCVGAGSAATWLGRARACLLLFGAFLTMLASPAGRSGSCGAAQQVCARRGSAANTPNRCAVPSWLHRAKGGARRLAGTTPDGEPRGRDSCSTVLCSVQMCKEPARNQVDTTAFALQYST